VLIATLNENGGFNEDIVKPLVFFLKINVVGEEAIHDLGRGLNVTRLGHEAVFVAEIVILFH
jgi:hypothetical protein